MKTVRIDLSSDLLVVDLIRQYSEFCEYKRIYNDPGNGVEFINDRNGIPVFHYSKVIRINESPHPVVIIDLLTENIHVSAELARLDPTKKYIFVSNGTWDRNRYPQLPPNYEVITEYFFINEWSNLQKNKINWYVDVTRNTNYINYSWCALIGTAKPTRDYLVDQLLADATGNFSLSYSGIQLAGTRSTDINYDFTKFDAYQPVETKSFFSISNSIPMGLFNTCNFTLVVETVMDLHGEFHLTEKTLKAIVASIPFVMVAGPYFLKNMHRLGFRSYSELWDEGYDEIEDMPARVAAIIALTNELQHFDWCSNQVKLLEIANHNKLHLAYGYSKIMKDTFLQIEQVFNEI